MKCAIWLGVIHRHAEGVLGLSLISSSSFSVCLVFKYFFFLPATFEISKIRVSEEPYNSLSPSLDEAPKVDGLSGKQASSSVLERKKTQVSEFMFEEKFTTQNGQRK